MTDYPIYPGIGAKECEKLLQNFAEKQRARKQEIEALEAKKKALDLRQKPKGFSLGRCLWLDSAIVRNA